MFRSLRFKAVEGYDADGSCNLMLRWTQNSLAHPKLLRLRMHGAMPPLLHYIFMTGNLISKRYIFMAAQG
jgi:hypothetical protein